MPTISDQIIISSKELVELKTLLADKPLEIAVEVISLLLSAYDPQFHLGQTDIYYLKLAIMVHDFGKLLIAQTILNAPRNLTEQELKTIYKHPLYGIILLSLFKIFDLGILEPTLYHHNTDECLKNIDRSRLGVFTKIIAIADVVDALASRRVYKRALVYEEAIKILMRKVKDNELDSNLLELLMKDNVLKELYKISNYNQSE